MAELRANLTAKKERFNGLYRKQLWPKAGRMPRHTDLAVAERNGFGSLHCHILGMSH